MKVSTMKQHVSRLFSSVKRNLQAFRTPATPSQLPEPTEDRPRYFTVIVEVTDRKEANVRLLESTIRLASALQPPDGCHIRSCYEISTELARVIINM
jgi:hypothetical protein